MLQCTKEEACAFLGVTTTRFRQLLKDPRVKKAWEEGMQCGKLSLRRKQLMLATTNAQMAIHLGKQYLGQTDIKGLEINGNIQNTHDLSKLTTDERKQLRSLIVRSEGASSSA